MRGAAAVGTLSLTLGMLSTTPALAATVTIDQVQGTGDRSDMVNDEVTLEGVYVTAKYTTPSGGFRGFTVQTAGTGGTRSADDTASDAIFVFADGPESIYSDLQIGDAINVTGVVDEYSGLTEIKIKQASAITKATNAGDKPTPVTNAWTDFDSNEKRESVESMLYEGTTEFVLANNYPLGRYGELGLAVGEVPIQPTEVGAPGSDEAAAQAKKNVTISVGLDDGTNQGFFRDASKGYDARTLPYLEDGVLSAVGD
ncbi:MAG: hypothetical protein L0G99_02280 [Propionibacteriales bacterium]|nr:hypothetical protein [Propionibacteriales bacterium]